MNSSRLFPSFVIAAMLALVFLTAARGADATTAIKYSDPSKPGTVKIVLANGDLHIIGADTNEITVESEGRTPSRSERKDGMRVLTAASSFSLTEKDNVVTLDASDHLGRGGDIQLTVPRRTSIIVQSSFGGDIVSSGITGDYEIHSLNGEVELEDVRGSVVVDTMQGDIRAEIRELKADKPLSFTSMNGEIELRVPSNAKANVRLRTQNGDVLTNFEETVLVTKTENASGTMRNRRGFNQVLPPEAADAIRNAAKIAAQAGREMAEAARQGFDAASTDAARAQFEAARAKIEAERAKVEAERASVEAERAKAAMAAQDARNAGRNGPAIPAIPAVPAVPAVPYGPTITGGKLVTGTLNGGGPEINVATMNGDVTLGKLD